MMEIFIRHYQVFFFCVILMVLGTACSSSSTNTTDTANEETESDKQIERIVSLSGSITEILFTLGYGDNVVGVDVTSTYPADAVQQKAQVGHVRNLNIEALLGLNPDLIIAEQSDKDKPVFTQLQNAGADLLFLDGTHTLDKPVNQAKTIIAKIGGEQEALQKMIDQQEQERQQLQTILTAAKHQPTVLFIYARGKGSMMVAGKNTPAEAMIELAGGKNAVNSFEGFKALSVEGLVEADPDVILMFESGLKSLGGKDGLYSIPGIEQTQAGINGRVIAMEGLYLLGFTPRVTKAAVQLAQQLQAFDYGESLTYYIKK